MAEKWYLILENGYPEIQIRTCSIDCQFMVGDIVHEGFYNYSTKKWFSFSEDREVSEEVIKWSKL